MLDAVHIKLKRVDLLTAAQFFLNFDINYLYGPC